MLSIFDLVDILSQILKARTFNISYNGPLLVACDFMRNVRLIKIDHVCVCEVDR